MTNTPWDVESEVSQLKAPQEQNIRRRTRRHSGTSVKITTTMSSCTKEGTVAVGTAGRRGQWLADDLPCGVRGSSQCPCAWRCRRDPCWPDCGEDPDRAGVVRPRNRRGPSVWGIRRDTDPASWSRTFGRCRISARGPVRAARMTRMSFAARESLLKCSSKWRRGTGSWAEGHTRASASGECTVGPQSSRRHLCPLVRMGGDTCLGSTRSSGVQKRCLVCGGGSGCRYSGSRTSASMAGTSPSGPEPSVAGRIRSRVDVRGRQQ